MHTYSRRGKRASKWLSFAILTTLRLFIIFYFFTNSHFNRFFTHSHSIDSHLIDENTESEWLRGLLGITQLGTVRWDLNSSLWPHAQPSSLFNLDPLNPQKPSDSRFPLSPGFLVRREEATALRPTQPPTRGAIKVNCFYCQFNIVL